MKTAEESLESVFEKEGFTLHFALNLPPQQNLANDPSYRRILFAMEKYAEQFKPKWIPIKSIDDLPSNEGKYFTYCTTDYSPFYRIDIFCGRLSNAIHHTSGKPIFSHYAIITDPSAP